MDARFLQAHKEARWSFALAILYLAAWGLSAWLVGSEIGFTGLPRWFEVSCLYVPLLFLVLCWLMIRTVFRDMSLEDNHGN
ncbi:YhdT family protein [Erwiniaceae bacterium BAC15a-03b]|uniref:YhdT family protein n=1 Tax=Winslowiella arboricola TaxID=2978220 RepID=A0A9J6PRX1_9GAMM|nr:YhdT family protein [Winslowiella arboricola]MCU5771263.1 YhdT family protein [Winslowiella arboricola]MCU5776807.1 YhdT family protein [Winslowiella arboricola]